MSSPTKPCILVYQDQPLRGKVREHSVRALAEAGLLRFQDGNFYLDIERLIALQEKGGPKSSVASDPGLQGVASSDSQQDPGQSDSAAPAGFLFPTCDLTSAIGATAKHFDAFWAEWPKSLRKGGKADCLRHWKAMHLDSQNSAILSCLQFWKKHQQWDRSRGDFIPAPIVWLRKRLWEDGDTTPGTATPPASNPEPPSSTFKRRRLTPEDLAFVAALGGDA